MTKKVKIEKIVNSWDSACVHLTDGSELEGVISVESKTAAGITTATIKAYVYPEKPITWVNSLTKETVNLTAKQSEMFFRNRNPFEWRQTINMDNKV